MYTQLVFFFVCYGDHRDLHVLTHSFPTRRSSDLLTLYFHDPKFIQVKPTILYAMFAGILGFGLVTGRPLLEALLGSAYPGLNALGWRKLTRNWAVFFVAMALLNEIVWRSTNWDFWVGFKLWGALPLTFLFALANVPMLMRHGLTVAEKAVTDLPPEG